MALVHDWLTGMRSGRRLVRFSETLQRCIRERWPIQPESPSRFTAVRRAEQYENTCLVEDSGHHGCLLLGAALASPAQTIKVLAHTNDPLAHGLTDSSFAPLLQGTDGYFYGTTFADGTNGHGTVFRMTPVGAVTFFTTFVPRRTARMAHIL